MFNGVRRGQREINADYANHGGQHANSDSTIGHNSVCESDQVRRIGHHELKAFFVFTWHIKREIVIVEGELPAVFLKPPVILKQLCGYARISFLQGHDD